MKAGEIVYFFNSKRELDTGMVLRCNKGVYVINNGKRLYKRTIREIGRNRNAEINFNRLQNKNTGR